MRGALSPRGTPPASPTWLRTLLQGILMAWPRTRLRGILMAWHCSESSADLLSCWRRVKPSNCRRRDGCCCRRTRINLQLYRCRRVLLDLGHGLQVSDRRRPPSVQLDLGWRNPNLLLAACDRSRRAWHHPDASHFDNLIRKHRLFDATLCNFLVISGGRFLDHGLLQLVHAMRVNFVNLTAFNWRKQHLSLNGFSLALHVRLPSNR
mmetsp:Transcript_28294/g.59966  ORF Transcript_28294/g.59966 Transcript_28294/m.59966 type:complete len:207 (-) Transcript_28294:760-1380(-)